MRQLVGRAARKSAGVLNPVAGATPAPHRALAVIIAALLVAGLVGAAVVQPTPAVASGRALSGVRITTTTAAPPPTFIPEPEPAPPPTPRPSSGSRPVNPSGGSSLEPIVKIGTIEIPKIGLVHEIYHGITMRNINLGPSHWPGTAMPGENGNSVFAGHRVTHSHPFRNVHLLAPGDKVIFTVNGVRSVYTVNGSKIVTPKQVEIANPTPTPTATIFGCHPPGSARFRYVVTMDLSG